MYFFCCCFFGGNIDWSIESLRCFSIKSRFSVCRRTKTTVNKIGVNNMTLGLIHVHVCIVFNDNLPTEYLTTTSALPAAQLTDA